MAYCCLNYQATNEYLKSTTLHFSNNLKSPVEHILLTTCHLAPFPIKEGRKTITHTKRKAFVIFRLLCLTLQFT